MKRVRNKTKQKLYKVKTAGSTYSDWNEGQQEIRLTKVEWKLRTQSSYLGCAGHADPVSLASVSLRREGRPAATVIFRVLEEGYFWDCF